MIEEGLRRYRDLVDYPELMSKFKVMGSTFKYLSKIGPNIMRNEDYEKNGSWRKKQADKIEFLEIV